MIKIRKLDSKDFTVLTDDHSLWDLKKKGYSYLEWLSQYNPTDWLSLVITINEMIVGYYGTITVPLKIEDKIVHSYRGGLFVHPEHRKKSYNILNLLVRALNDETRKRQGILYGFPTANLLKYYIRKIKYSSLKHIPRYACVLRIAYVFERIFKMRWLALALAYFFQPLWRFWLFKTKRYPRGVEIKEIHTFDKRFNGLWEKASKAHNIIAIRDTEYLNWRYTKEPDQAYIIFTAEKNHELLGYIILKPCDEKNKKIGVIMDIFGIQDKVVTQALFFCAMEYFDKAGADKIELCLSNNHYENILEEMGFKKKPSHPGMSDVLMAKCYCLGIDLDNFNNPANWYITTTDMIIA